MKYVVLFFSLFPVILSAQYHFNFENDSTGGCGLSTATRMQQVPDGRWECSEDGAISGNFSLHHSYDNPRSGCDYFIISHDPFQDSDSLSITFRVKHSYPPSTANNWQVALLATFLKEGAHPGKITGGLILGVNFTGSDDYVKVWSCTNGECEQICNTPINYQELIGTEAAPQFRMVWYRGGRLDLYCSQDPAADLSELPDLLELAGSCQLDSLPEGRLTIVRYEYSASQDRKLWLDEIELEGNFIPDTIAPALMGIVVMDETHLHLLFSEKISLTEHTSFVLSGAGGAGALVPAGEMFPDTISTLDRGLVLGFPGSIPNRVEFGLRVKGVCDEDGNCLSDTLVRLMRNEAVWGDVVFTEVMYDPDPVVRLPDAEYLEILNRSPCELDLEGWKLRINDRSYLISGLSVDPGKYGLMVDFTLPNDGAILALYNRNETLIHAVRYGLPWDGPAWKKEGGWSLESPDPDLVCSTSRLWEFSTDHRGGTPGRKNSIDAELEDHDPPVFMYGGFEEPGTLHLYFSEPVRFSPADTNLVSVMPGAVHPDSVVPGSPLGDLLSLYFSEHLPDRQGFSLRLPSVVDCSGNPARELTIRMGEPGVPRFGSLLINEIMYDPEDGAPEYIELYNPGQQYFDLQDLSVDVVKEGGPMANLAGLSEHSRILSPGEYLVITRDVQHMMDAYDLELSGRWLELRNLSGLHNTGGTIYLANRTGDIMDVANYGNYLHMELLKDTKGVSLERISADRAGTDPGNWHSAASIEGYATPGRKNSQSVHHQGEVELVRVDPVVFSPDNDGYQDLLVISFSPDVQGCVLRIWITDLAGNPVRSLANNHIAGPSSSYVWDGESNDGQMVAEGIYVIHLWGYHPASGNRWNRKVAAGIIYR